MISKNYICERCNNSASIVHHKIYINDKNVDDINITLNFDNLEALCYDCHNKEHFETKEYDFDLNGDLIAHI